MSNNEEILRKTPLPSLKKLSERHLGLYEPLCRAYADAAGVCFSRHHNSPADLRINNHADMCVREVYWDDPDARTLASWANTDDATRDGAYSVTLAIIEAEFGMIAISRADTKSGADYYIGLPDATDLENAFRLEVSGTDQGDLSAIRARLKEKLDQLGRGNSSKPGIATVIGFHERYAIIERILDS